MYKMTEEERIQKINTKAAVCLEEWMQKIEDEEEKLKILKELVGYKSFEDYVDDHEKEFEKIDISDDFKTIR